MKFSGKSASCDNIKSYKDQGLYVLSKKFSFEKTTGDANEGKGGKYREDKGRKRHFYRMDFVYIVFLHIEMFLILRKYTMVKTV